MLKFFENFEPGPFFHLLAIVGNKLVQSVGDIIGKLTNHLFEFLNRDILPDFNREVVDIMDSIFFISAVQSRPHACSRADRRDTDSRFLPAYR